MKHRHGQGKWISKKVVEPILARNIIYRTKPGFGAPLRRWMHHEFSEVVGEHFSHESIRAWGLFDAAEVRRLIAMDKARKVDGAYTIFSLLCIELWCRLFLDGQWRRHAAA